MIIPDVDRGLEHSMTPKNHQGHTEHCSFRNLPTSCQGPYMLTKVNEMSKLIRKRGESQDIALLEIPHSTKKEWTLMHEPFGSVEPPFLILFFGGTNMLKTIENCWSWHRCYWRIPPSNPFPTKLQRLNLGIGCPGITIISLNRCSRKKNNWEYGLKQQNRHAHAHQASSSHIRGDSTMIQLAKLTNMRSNSA